MAANRNPTPDETKMDQQVCRKQGQPGQITHGAYAIERRVRYDEIDARTRLGRRVRNLRLGYALHFGYPTWTSVPAPVRAAIRSAVRLELFAELLFEPFWRGEEPPKRFDTVTENLRRILADMGFEPRGTAGPDVAALLLQMRADDERQR